MAEAQANPGRWRWVYWAGAVVIALVGVFVYGWVTAGPGIGAPPSEAFRVYHPAGFSIVAPEGWKVRFDDLDGMASISISPGTRSRYQPFYDVISGEGRLPEREYPNRKFEPGTFQGKPAEIYIGPQGKYSSWQAVFERDGRWYHLSVMVHAYGEVVKPSEKLMAYVQTFRVETGAATRPAGSVAEK